MRASKRIRDGFMPWAGLALGTGGYFLAHQLGSDAVFEDCRVGSPVLVIGGIVAGLLVIGLGAAGSWRIYAESGERAARRPIAAVGLLTSALYVIGLVLPLIAALLIPRCWA